MPTILPETRCDPTPAALGARGRGGVAPMDCAHLSSVSGWWAGAAAVSGRARARRGSRGSGRDRSPVPPQNPVDRAIVDVSRFVPYVLRGKGETPRHSRRWRTPTWVPGWGCFGVRLWFTGRRCIDRTR